MKRIVVIVEILTTALSVWGQIADVDSYVGEMRERAGPLMCKVGTPNRVLVADLTAFNAIGATNSTHLDLPHAVFENQIGSAPSFMRMGSSKFQIRHTRRHSRQHYRRLP
jgi:hypothetical protein